MSELNERFDRLAQEVSDQTRPPGASQAIRAAGRRRQSVMAAAAVCVLAAGGITVGAITGDDSDGRDQRPSDSGTGEVAVLDPQDVTPAAADRATRGWADGWSSETTPVLTDPPCLSGAGLDGLDPTMLGKQADLGMTEVGLSSYTLEMPASEPGSEVFTKLNRAIDECQRQPRETNRFTFSDQDRASFSTWAATTGDPEISLWIVQDGQVLNLTVIAGDLGVPSTQVQRDVAALADAKLHWDAAPIEGQQLPTSSQITAESFDKTTAGWTDGWDSGPHDAEAIPRCVSSTETVDLKPQSLTDRGVRLHQGDQVTMNSSSMRLESPQLAQELRARLTQSIRDCDTPASTVTETRLYEDSQVTFAAFPASEGAPASHLWIVQLDTGVTLMVIEGYLPVPSAAVRERVAIAAARQLTRDAEPDNPGSGH